LRIPRPTLHLPRLRRRGTEPDAPERPPIAEEDVRLLRRTRLRLIGVSGLVTLLILVVLGASMYEVVSVAIRNSETAAFQSYLQRHKFVQPSATSPEPADLSGDAMNIFEIVIRADGTAVPPDGQKSAPVGLPDQRSLTAAINSSAGTNETTIVTSDGTQWHILSARAVIVTRTGPEIGMVQVVQNLTPDNKFLNTLLLVLVGGGLLALLASLLAGYLYAGRALIPIRESIVRRQGALQRQREFAANASHELRTPLTVIGASVEDLRRNRRSKVEDVGDALGDIEAEVKHMTALVEDMLLLARTDSGVVEIERVPVDLGDIAAEAASMLATLGQERGVHVVLDPLPAQMVGDPVRLRQLVTILVDNAIRHSSAGSTVEARIRPAVGAVVLQVDDQGHGIKPDDLPRLFERFWRADDAPAGGTGLGLAIAKWIVEQHGGRIGAVNRPEGGASFRVWLPSHPGKDVVQSANPMLGGGEADLLWAGPGAAEPPAPEAGPSAP
jgi:signal transduction histidine kinase